MHRGVFQSSVSWITTDGAWESCRDVWVYRVRLASDRASTDCWRRPCAVCSRKIGLNLRKTPPNTWAPCAVPGRPVAGLTSPHQNVRWQNRKAAVCSRHLKVHLHTPPASSVSPLLSLPRQRRWATETWAWVSTHVGFNNFFCRMFGCIYFLFFLLFFLFFPFFKFH